MNVIEIFESIDGEVNHWGQGIITTFVRFAGCNLNCKYCDTPESRNVKNGKEMSPEEIYSKILTDKVTLTGGEPLLQDSIESFITVLLNEGKKVSVETNGTMEIAYHSDEEDISYIVDYKIKDANLINHDNFKMLTSQDFIKFVIEEKEYVQALFYARILQPLTDAQIAFSPISPFSVKELLQRLLRDNMRNVHINAQLHKLLNLK